MIWFNIKWFEWKWNEFSTKTDSKKKFRNSSGHIHFVSLVHILFSRLTSALWQLWKKYFFICIYKLMLESVSYRHTTMGTYYDDTTKIRNGNKEQNSHKWTSVTIFSPSRNSPPDTRNFLSYFHRFKQLTNSQTVSGSQ